MKHLCLFSFFFFYSQAYALACVVCFGDPNSLQSKGTVAGVAFLIFVIGGVLAAIAVTAFRWSRRAKKLDEIKMATPERGRHLMK